MAEFIEEKYKSIFKKKQDSINQYKAAINNLLGNFYNRPYLKENDILVAKQFKEGMDRTIDELQKLQEIKWNMINPSENCRSDSGQPLSVDIPDHFKNDFFDHLNFENASFSFVADVSSFLDSKSNHSNPLEKDENESEKAIVLDDQLGFEKEPIKEDIEKVELNEDNIEEVSDQSNLKNTPSIKGSDQNNHSKKKSKLKISIKNDAPLPPPWINRP